MRLLFEIDRNDYARCTRTFRRDSARAVIIEDGRIVQSRVVLMKTEKSGIPYVHGHTETGQEIFDYLQKITDEAGLNVRLSWDGDEAVLTPKN